MPHLCTRTKYPDQQDVFKQFPSVNAGITKPRVETESYVTTACYRSWTAKTVKLNGGLNHVRRHTKSTQTFSTNPLLRSSLRCFAGVLSGYWHCLIHKVIKISRFLVMHKKKVSEPRYKCDRPTITSMKTETGKITVTYTYIYIYIFIYIFIYLYIYILSLVFRPDVHNCFFKKSK
jgi:hypothetical protein